MSHPHPVDIHVGKRIKLRRMWLHMSQERLGHALGLTFQQVQKYERGTNRVGASRLFEIASALDVPIGFFFDGAPEPGKSTHTAMRTTAFPAPVDLLKALPTSDLQQHAQMLKIIQSYLRIDDATIRQRIVELLAAMTPD